ncbi:MAG: 50S ribosomal protein L23 [Bryobacterales bacterium]|nr:50S ribosomal protein L23 [Bryobacterales bacterium]
MNLYDILRRPLITEKALTKKENERTLCFEVPVEANKSQIRAAVEKIFKVRVEDVRTVVVPGKLRRRGRFAGYRPEWKKAYVKLEPGQKMPEFVEV